MESEKKEFSLKSFVKPLIEERSIIIGMGLTIIISGLASLLILVGRFFHEGIVLSTVIGEFSLVKSFVYNYINFDTNIYFVLGAEFVVILLITMVIAYAVVTKKYLMLIFGTIALLVIIAGLISLLYGGVITYNIIIVVSSLVLVILLYSTYFSGIIHIGNSKDKLRRIVLSIVLWIQTVLFFAACVLKANMDGSVIIPSVIIISLMVYPSFVNFLVELKKGGIDEIALKIFILGFSVICGIFLLKASYFTLYVSQINVGCTLLLIISLISISMVTSFVKEKFLSISKKIDDKLVDKVNKNIEERLTSQYKYMIMILFIIAPMGLLIPSSIQLSYSLGALLHGSYMETLDANDLVMKDLEDYERDLSDIIGEEVNIVKFDIIGRNDNFYNVLFVYRYDNTDHEMIDRINQDRFIQF